MKRIYFGLAVLMTLLFPFTDNLPVFQTLSDISGIPGFYLNLLLACASIAIFLVTSCLKYRVISPTPGGRLLLSGVVFYLLTGLLGGTAFMLIANLLGSNAQNFWSYLIPAIIVSKYIDLVILFVKAVLFLGAFRLLVNLLPSEAPSVT